jgi:hypothetical protein
MYITKLTYKRDIQGDLFQLTDLKFKRDYYIYCLGIVDKIAKSIPNNIIFAGGTG